MSLGVETAIFLFNIILFIGWFRAVLGWGACPGEGGGAAQEGSGRAFFSCSGAEGHTVGAWYVFTDSLIQGSRMLQPNPEERQ